MTFTTVTLTRPTALINGNDNTIMVIISQLLLHSTKESKSIAVTMPESEVIFASIAATMPDSEVIFAKARHLRSKMNEKLFKSNKSVQTALVAHFIKLVWPSFKRL
ncbi:hypothetical protein AVEN_17922-1 [Araneus ventricosus]|uniref:Uncharacterized protein n=1 Tax=Araneus ventricosus TaxID=182803 RepID=A0A4Y2G3U5_ARAVE|nr:hypothetical protein AVEN_17922-1 [Araneus ventricosus]